ncbi:UBN2 domain-containing protein, partial [Cephalotus follicularis]
YLQQFKEITDQLAACGSPVSKDEVILCVLDGLPPSYRQFSSSVGIQARTSTLSLEELDMLLIFEEISLANESSTINAATAFMRSQMSKNNLGRNSSNYRGRGTQQRGGYSNQGRGPSNPSLATTNPNNSTNNRASSNNPIQKLAVMSAFSSFDPHTCYSDTGASHHKTLDLGDLSPSSKYFGTKNVEVRNGQGLCISNT